MEKEEELYSINDFIYWIIKYNNEILDEKKWSKSQIAAITAKAMINFHDETQTIY